MPEKIVRIRSTTLKAYPLQPSINSHPSIAELSKAERWARLFSRFLADRMLLNWIPFQRKEVMFQMVLWRVARVTRRSLLTNMLACI